MNVCLRGINNYSICKGLDKFSGFSTEKEVDKVFRVLKGVTFNFILRKYGLSNVCVCECGISGGKSKMSYFFLVGFLKENSTNTKTPKL